MLKELFTSFQDSVSGAATISSAGVDPFIFGLTIFVLACFVGYFVVWKVTPALHTPLMAEIGRAHV